MCRTSQKEVIKITKQESAIKKIKETNPNYTILSEFIGWRDDIKRKCNICGDIRIVKARSLVEKNKNGEIRKCPVCAAKERAKSSRKTHDQFIKELCSINSNIKIIGKYHTNSEKIKCKCLIDDFEWESTPHSLLDGHGCPECKRTSQNWRTPEQFISEMEERHPTITPLTKFTRVNDTMKFKCKICGYEWQTAPNILLNKDNYGCPKCSNHGFVSEEDVIERLNKYNPTIKYVSGYKGTQRHANFECLRCGNKWHTIVNSVLRGRGCPNCNLSHGALKIKEFLKTSMIDYETEYRFDDCRDIRPLPFDFYIKSKNTCIEYDGKQHFVPSRFSKSMTYEDMKDNLRAVKRRDKIKNDYCKNHGIKLIRIPYTDFDNIEKILNEYFS